MNSPTKSMAKLITATKAAAEATAATMRNDWETQRQEHWQRSHVKVISCKVSTDEHTTILKQCREAHCTRYALLRLLIIQYLQAMEAMEDTNQ